MTAARVIAVVQARLGSTRLPGKALSPIAGRPMLEHVLARAAAVPGIDGVVLATTTSPEDAALVDLARAAGIASARGSVSDVLDRFSAALAEHPADAVVRITADCPLLDPGVAGRVVAEYRRRAGGVDYVSNVHPPTFPDGLDTEVISAPALVCAWREATAASDREHVTPYVWSRPERFRIANVTAATDLSSLRWTVDDARDLAFVREVYRQLAPEGGPGAARFGMDAVLDVLRAHPEIGALNAGTRRNEGFERARRADLAAAQGAGA
jgi:spore coat polysaccharide biosynthesis protein SpsF (cytidylyltransferase family)